VTAQTVTRRIQPGYEAAGSSPGDDAQAAGTRSVKNMAVVRVHHYSVDEADDEEFLKRRAAVIDAIRADHPGLSKTTLVKLEDGPYTDTWQWDSPAQMAAAFAAARTVAEIGQRCHSPRMAPPSTAT
jgi:hypothetical protein